MTTPHLSGAAAAEDETISTGSVTELTFIWTDLVKKETTPPQKINPLVVLSCWNDSMFSFMSSFFNVCFT